MKNFTEHRARQVPRQQRGDLGGEQRHDRRALPRLRGGEGIRSEQYGPARTPSTSRPSTRRRASRSRRATTLQGGAQRGACTPPWRTAPGRSFTRSGSPARRCPTQYLPSTSRRAPPAEPRSPVAGPRSGRAIRRPAPQPPSERSEPMDWLDNISRELLGLRRHGGSAAAADQRRPEEHAVISLAATVLGIVIGMVLAVMGISQSRWLRLPARIYTDIFRGPAGDRHDPDHRPGLRPDRPRDLRPVALSARHPRAQPDRRRLYRRDLPRRHPERRARPAGGLPRARHELRPGHAPGRHPAGHPAGAAGAGEPVHRATSRTPASSTSSACSPPSGSCSGSARIRPSSPATCRRCCWPASSTSSSPCR